MKEKYLNITEQINEILQAEDLMGLIKIGAPSHEYSHEGLMAFERMNRFDTVDQIKDKLWEIFYAQFCYGTVCRQVDGVWEEKYEVITPREEADRFIGLKSKYTEAAKKIYKIYNP